MKVSTERDKEKMAVTQMETQSSALRYGLLKVKPIPFEETVKINGIRGRVTRKGISFKHDEQTELEKFEDFISYTYEQVFKKVPIPDNFSKKQLIEHLINKSIDKAKKDEEFMKHLEKKEKSLFDYISFIKERYEKKIPKYYEFDANIYLKSNLPLSLFTQSSMYIDTYQKYLTLVKRVVRRFEIKSNMGGVRDRFKKTDIELKIMQKELSPLIDKMDLCSTDYFAQSLYIYLWSIEKIEDLDNLDSLTLDINKLDQAYFQEYYVALNQELKGMRRLLFTVSKRFEPDLFSKEIQTDTSATIMLSKIIAQK